MRRFILLFMLLPILANAQELNWFELGSTWTYQYTDPFDPDQVVYELVVGVEEIIEYNGHMASKVEVSNGNNPFSCAILQPAFYFYESNDSVYYSTDELSTYYLAYVIPSDLPATWIYTIEDPDWETNGDFIVNVSSSDQINIDGFDLMQAELEYTPTSFDTFIDIYPNTRTVLEGVGGIDHFIIPLGSQVACDPWIALDFVCFSSPSFDYQHPDYESCVLSTSQRLIEEKGRLFPNPAKNWLRLKGDVDWVQIRDCKGTIIININEINDELIDIQGLAPGLYIVLSEKDGIVKSERLVIQ